jgi:hypothetical protein
MLFDEKPPAVVCNPASELDPAYVHIRDDSDCKEDRQYLEGLWAEFLPYADHNFLDQFRRRGKFHSRVWEMRLTVVLKRLGLNVQPREARRGAGGPDIWIAASPNIWIEAVAPMPNESLEQSYRLSLRQPTPTPEDEIILRYTQAFNEKWKQYGKYISPEKRIVKPEDSFVVAISGAQLPRPSAPGRYGELPLIAKALYGIGDPYWEIEVATGRQLGAGFSHSPTRQKTKEAAVEADLFLSDKRAGISAVLYSPQHVKNRPEASGNIEGSDFRIFHNEFASVPLPRGLIKRGQEWATGDGMLRMLCNYSVANTDQPPSL